MTKNADAVCVFLFSYFIDNLSDERMNSINTIMAHFHCRDIMRSLVPVLARTRI